MHGFVIQITVLWGKLTGISVSAKTLVDVFRLRGTDIYNGLVCIWVTTTDMPYSEIKSECSDSLPK